MTFAFVFDAGPFRVRKYESVVMGFDIRVEVVCAWSRSLSFFSVSWSVICYQETNGRVLGY